MGWEDPCQGAPANIVRYKLKHESLERRDGKVWGKVTPVGEGVAPSRALIMGLKKKKRRGGEMGTSCLAACSKNGDESGQLGWLRGSDP